MPFDFDPTKDRRNRRDHGISLARIDDMNPATMLYEPDLREDYGEERWQVLGFIDDRLCHAAITFQPLRVFSLRRATRTEQEHYAQAFPETPRP